MEGSIEKELYNKNFDLQLQSFDINKFSYCVHLFSIVNNIIQNVVICCWGIVTSEGSFKSISKSETLQIIKHKQFFLKGLIILFNDSWKEINTSVIPKESLEKLKYFGGFEHDFCVFFNLFQLSKKVLLSLLDSFKLSDISSKENLTASVHMNVDVILASKYDEVQKNHQIKCLCEDSNIKILHLKERNEEFIYINDILS